MVISRRSKHHFGARYWMQKVPHKLNRERVRDKVKTRTADIFIVYIFNGTILSNNVFIFYFLLSWVLTQFQINMFWTMIDQLRPRSNQMNLGLIG